MGECVEACRAALAAVEAEAADIMAAEAAAEAAAEEAAAAEEEATRPTLHTWHLGI
jgi:hypothetical protein